ncbi:TniB family NTP-binding protein [Chryseobacterium arthrosphaerae]|uniref:TniB family NTP-binding protein n=1 Tax=Chryseobacterium arthrosphaerae TaxID=651561 RepID=UPI0023E2BD7A|nr:TniB family NTP-binding protein [Chryseobacterium arthrosphaerae]WES96555.1 TniB family NTP-binding protein [Chryseobacterium arthrosphaerae]
MTHLHPKTQEIINNSSDKERIILLKKPKWIGYTGAKIIHKKLEELRDYPTNLRMPNLLLVGDSNNGKTALLHKFSELNKSYIKEETQELRLPVLMVQAPPEPDEKRFYNAILESLHSPYRSSEKAELRQQRVIHLLHKLNVKLLIIDEIQHVLAGTVSKQRLFLNVLKYLSNELKISMVCSGTREAFNAIQTDPQLANRFEPRMLNKWQYDEEYLRLLASFEKILPLKKPSILIDDSLSRVILNKSEGLLGEVSKILELASIYAIETGIESISKKVLDKIEYVSPSDRKKMIFR